MNVAELLLRKPRLLTARARLTLTYAGFTVVAGALALSVIYLVIRMFPDYPLTSAQFPNDPTVYVYSREEILDSLLALSAAALGVMAVVGVVGGWVVAGRVLRPLQALNHAARTAGGGDLQYRIAMPGRSDEFGELADTFDNMLARLEQSFLAQKRFAANASHELRTPLATTKMLIEVAQANPDGTDVERTLTRVHETNERGIAIVEALLQLNSLDRNPVRKEPVNLADLTRSVVDGVQAEAIAANVTITYSLQPAPMVGNEVLLSQMVSNLIYNAIRHNTAGGSVQITTSAPGGSSTVEVRNSGARLEQAVVDQFLEPFARGGARLASRESQSSGNGLGLALASRIAAVHQGELVLTAQPEGGLTVVFSLLSGQEVSYTLPKPRLD